MLLNEKSPEIFPKHKGYFFYFRILLDQDQELRNLFFYYQYAQKT